MKFFEVLNSMDRRYIYIIIAIATIIPLIFPLGLKTYTTSPVENLYRHIDAIAGREDMAIIMDFTQSPSVLPECYPMDLAILRHCFERDIKVFTMSSLAQGAAIIQSALTEVSQEFPDVQVNRDYCNFGYIPWYT